MTQKLWLSLGLATFVSAIAYPHALAQAETIIHYPENLQEFIQKDDEDDDRDTVVKLEIVVEGEEWANVYINGRRVFSPRIVNRSETFTLAEGVYDIRVAGTTLGDEWVEGYLEISGDDEASRIVVLRFSESGAVRISGNNHTWTLGERPD
ncbi:MAG: hypothetical protein AAGI69_24960 [Cyanobacteria bacterium P01_H01_bin.21]